MAKTNDLQKFMDDARERKKNEQLATQIFQKGRRQSAPSKLKPQIGGSLASRVGVKKQRASLGPTNAPKGPRLAGNVNGEWTHDLHNSLNSPAQRGGSLSSRITDPSKLSRPTRASTRRAAALDRMEIDSKVSDQVNIRSAPQQASGGSGKGITIRGLAGPFAVMGQNFAPGTTAADIESAMTPFGGEMESCKIVKTQPFIVVEMVFASREGGERVIETFNEKTADGRVLKVYPKIGGKKPPAPSQSKSSNAADQIVDGSMGFPEPNQRLYSDRLVNNDSQQHHGNSNGNASGDNRRGRRNPRGRGGR